MNLMLRSLIFYGLLVLVVGVSAAPILGAGAAESLDLGVRADGFGEGGRMVRWRQWRRRLLHDHDTTIGARMGDITDDELYDRSEDYRHPPHSHSRSQHCHEVLKAPAADRHHDDVPHDHPVNDSAGPVHLAKRGIKNFFKKVWGGIKKAAKVVGSLVRRDVGEDELYERSKLCSREGKSGVKMRRLEPSFGQ